MANKVNYIIDRLKGQFPASSESFYAKDIVDALKSADFEVLDEFAKRNNLKIEFEIQDGKPLFSSRTAPWPDPPLMQIRYCSGMASYFNIYSTSPDTRGLVRSYLKAQVPTKYQRFKEAGIPVPEGLQEPEPGRVYELETLSKLYSDPIVQKAAEFVSIYLRIHPATLGEYSKKEMWFSDQNLGTSYENNQDMIKGWSVEFPKHSNLCVDTSRPGSYEGWQITLTVFVSQDGSFMRIPGCERRTVDEYGSIVTIDTTETTTGRTVRPKAEGSTGETAQSKGISLGVLLWIGAALLALFWKKE